MAFRRGQQVVTGLRNADTDGDDEGIFFTDANGEEVVRHPLLRLGQREVHAESRASSTGRCRGSTSSGSSVLPGLGPVITTPLAKLHP